MKKAAQMAALISFDFIIYALTPSKIAIDVTTIIRVNFMLISNPLKNNTRKPLARYNIQLLMYYIKVVISSINLTLINYFLANGWFDNNALYACSSAIFV